MHFPTGVIAPIKVERCIEGLRPIHCRVKDHTQDVEIQQSVLALIPIENSNMCEYTRACLDPQLKVTTRLLLF